MTFGELIRLLEDCDRLRIIKDGKEVFVGWFAILKMHREVIEGIREDIIKGFRVIPEIRHKQWEELNLMRPLEPDETPDFYFRDLELKLYYTINI